MDQKEKDIFIEGENMVKCVRPLRPIIYGVLFHIDCLK